MTDSEVQGDEAGLAILLERWRAYDYETEAAAWDALREEAIPFYREALDSFLAGNMELVDFRAAIDSLSKSKPHWGFQGFGQMFFNQMVKVADTTDLAHALREALQAPHSEGEAADKIVAFQEVIERARVRADEKWSTKPGLGRANSFLTFFWEFFDREAWPAFFPNSRNVLADHGLLDVNVPQAELYIAYRRRIFELKELLGTGSWGVERLLWSMGQGKPEQTESGSGELQENLEPGDSVAPGNALYNFFRDEHLHFPDEAVTSLVLSLATKRFVILSGRSGTGKTRMALGLAQYFSSYELEESTAEVTEPVSDDSQLFIRLSPGKIKRGHVYMNQEARDWFAQHFDMPERGSSVKLSTRLPDGSSDQLRINNVNFADPDKHLSRLFFRKHIQDWLKQDSASGHLRFALSDDPDVSLELQRLEGPPPEGSGEDSQLVIAVRSDWTDPRGLIGYFNPITDSYVATSLLSLLLKADQDPERPYFVILDEMNLARVEYYFSDFLSAIESDAPIELMPKSLEEELLSKGLEDIPAEVRIPPNVSFLGTVNIDETTHSFSPKVLDRANVIEFNEVDVELALGHPSETEQSGFRLSQGPLPGWLCAGKENSLAASEAAFATATFTGCLEDVHGLLLDFNLHFGYRVIAEVGAFVGHALEKVGGNEEDVVLRAFDLQLQQKIIPKFSGGRELEEPLAHLLSYCLTGIRSKSLSLDETIELATKSLDPTSEEGVTPVFRGSARKLSQMLRRLDAAGFVNALE